MVVPLLDHVLIHLIDVREWTIGILDDVRVAPMRVGDEPIFHCGYRFRFVNGSDAGSSIAYCNRHAAKEGSEVLSLGDWGKNLPPPG